MLIAILLLLVIAFVFQPLKTKTQLIVDKLFFKEKYNYQKTLKNLSQIANSIPSVDELLDQITGTVTATLKTDKSSIFLYDKDKNIFARKS